MTVFHGTKHDDTFNESSDTTSDTFALYKGGNDTVTAGSGNDVFKMGAALNADDRLDGGAGHDLVVLSGDYSAGLVLQDATLQNIEVLRLRDGFDYQLTLADGNVAFGQFLTVNAGALGAGHTLTLDGSRETDGRLIVVGGAGNDVLTGGAKSDTFDLTRGGKDTVHAGNGNDTIQMGDTLTAADIIDGGTGADTVVLHGLQAPIHFTATTMVNVETLQLLAGNYNITTDDATVAAGETLTVDASALTAGFGLVFDGHAETNGLFKLIGGVGSDILTGGALSDTFDLSHGGNDEAHGNGSADTFLMGAALTSADAIDGGAGGDTVDLHGDYSAGVTFGAATITNVETLLLDDGFSYKLTTNDGNVAAGLTLTVIASLLTVGHTLTFDGSAESDGHFAIIGGAGDDTLTGGMNADTFDLTHGGNDTASGGAGNDTFNFGAAFTAADKVDGGANSDTIDLNGDYSAGVTFGAATMTNVERIVLEGGHSYSLTTNDANVASGQTLTIDASGLNPSDHLIFDGSAETNGKFFITGGNGADTLTGGGGADIFSYTDALQSTSTTHDTITNFAAGTDKFDLELTHFVTQVYSASGSLDGGANFDSELAALNVKHVNGATEITVTGGTLAGHIILLVDGDGNAQYDAGHDYVIDITGHTGTLTTSDFI